MSTAANPLKRLETVAGAPQMLFPLDVEQHGHFISIACYRRKTHGGMSMSGLRGQSIKDKAIGEIYLPMPASLSTAYQIDYQNEDLGALGEAVAGITSQTIDSVAAGVQETVKGLASAETKWDSASAVASGVGKVFSSFYEKAKESFTAPGAAAGAVDTLAAVGARKAPASVKAGIAAARGVAANPHRVVLFQGVQFKEHQFSYRLSPKNSAESKVIRAIIANLKMWMHPYYADMSGSSTSVTAQIKRNFLTYPHIFKLRFSQPEYLFSYKTSILKSFNVQYHPQGYAAYIRDESSVAPAEVEISMTFQEMDMWDAGALAFENEKRVKAEQTRGKAAAEDNASGLADL